MVALAGVGNGCRGAELRDGAAHATPALADAVEGLARAVPGFCIGRFDLEAPSWEHFRRGEAIRVREVHGVAFEAAHVSDARYGVLHAWRTLYRQWALAFEAGRRNRARGARPLGARGLVALLLAARRRRG
jgi:hypothetical protein